MLFVNPRSGDGKAARARLAERARERGIDVVVLRPGDNLPALVDQAVADGADVLGVAGGDGSLAVAAAAALAHGLPFVCVPAGTRNHFALDVGVDRADLVGALDALTQGVESRIDVAEVNGRIFLNNVSLGIYGAWRPGSWPDRLATLGAYLGISFPVYWVGLILILLFAVTLRWLPPSGSGGWAYLVLPAVTLGMRSVAFLSRITRDAMRELLASDFIRTARAKGLTERRVVLGHAFRNALIPVVTVLGLDFGSYLTGSILTETIFSWPGVGRYVLTAIDKRDLPAIQGSILFLSLVFVMVNLMTDVVYAVVDRRVRYGG